MLKNFVGCFGFNGPSRQYFRLYLAVSQRVRRIFKSNNRREKNVQTTPICTCCKHITVGCCPTNIQLGCVAQSVGHPTCKSGVLGSIPGLATYFRFSFHFFKKGRCQLLVKVCARSTGKPLRRSKPVQEK